MCRSKYNDYNKIIKLNDIIAENIQEIYEYFGVKFYENEKKL